MIPKPSAALPGIALARLLIGLLQGVGLYLLYLAADAGMWPATDRLVFAPLSLAGFCIPLIAIAGLSNMRGRVLFLWSIGAALLLVGLAAHDITRDAEGGLWLWGTPNKFLPSLLLMCVAGVILFIAQTLLVAGDAERRVIARYSRYFDVAWKHSLQIVLCASFVGLFWILLWLGAGLFKLIDIEYFEKLIQHRWFAIPATTLAIACAIHVTDVRGGVVRGMRSVVHVLMSWLLPTLTVIVGGFLASLPFTGLAPLWSTRYATALLLTTAVALVVLVNATYQDGLPEHRAARVLRIAGSAAAFMLLPLIAISAYALALRIGQHGWTVDRVIAAACVAIGAIHAIGYGWAAIQQREWLKPLELCNVTAAFASLAVLLALFSPVADPARLAVASQVARLESGDIAPDKFDFNYLRFDTARYGKDALKRLSEIQSGPNAAEISSRAEGALRLTQRRPTVPPTPTAVQLTANITVYPQGRTLPETFAHVNWGAPPDSRLVPACMRSRASICEAYMFDLDGDGADEIIVSDWSGYPSATVFKLYDDRRWHIAGTFAPQIGCDSIREALRAGDFKLVPSTWRDIEIAGRRVHLSQYLPPNAAVQEKCP